MEVRAKKALGQHFLTDQDIARNIVGSLLGSDVLEVGPGMGVLTQYLIPRLSGAAVSEGSTASLRSAPPEPHQSAREQVLLPTSSSPVPPLNMPRVAVVSPFGAAAPAKHLKVVEIDKESVEYLQKHYPALGEGLIEGDFLRMDLGSIFPGPFSIIGNFPYNISSQIFFKILEYRDKVPEVVCMIQKEVAQRIAEKPGTKTYGILSVFLQAWYDIDYLFTVGPGAFNPPPKVQSAVIRLTRNSRTSLGCDEKLFRTVVKTAFGQRRKTLRNSLKPVLQKSAPFDKLRERTDAQIMEPDSTAEKPAESRPVGSLTDNPIFDLRPERLSVEDFIRLTLMIQR